MSESALLFPFAASGLVLLLLGADLADRIGKTKLRRLAAVNLVVTLFVATMVGLVRWFGAVGGASVDPSQSAAVHAREPFSLLAIGILVTLVLVALAAWVKRRRGTS